MFRLLKYSKNKNVFNSNGVNSTITKINSRYFSNNNNNINNDGDNKNNSIFVREKQHNKLKSYPGSKNSLSELKIRTHKNFDGEEKSLSKYHKSNNPKKIKREDHGEYSVQISKINEMYKDNNYSAKDMIDLFEALPYKTEEYGEFTAIFRRIIYKCIYSNSLMEMFVFLRDNIHYFPGFINSSLFINSLELFYKVEVEKKQTLVLEYYNNPFTNLLDEIFEFYILDFSIVEKILQILLGAGDLKRFDSVFQIYREKFEINKALTNNLNKAFTVELEENSNNIGNSLGSLKEESASSDGSIGPLDLKSIDIPTLPAVIIFRLAHRAILNNEISNTMTLLNSLIKKNSLALEAFQIILEVCHYRKLKDAESMFLELLAKPENNRWYSLLIYYNQNCDNQEMFYKLLTYIDNHDKVSIEVRNDILLFLIPTFLSYKKFNLGYYWLETLAKKYQINIEKSLYVFIYNEVRQHNGNAFLLSIWTDRLEDYCARVNLTQEKLDQSLRLTKNYYDYLDVYNGFDYFLYTNIYKTNDKLFKNNNESNDNNSNSNSFSEQPQQKQHVEEHEIEKENKGFNQKENYQLTKNNNYNNGQSLYNKGNNKLNQKLFLNFNELNDETSIKVYGENNIKNEGSDDSNHLNGNRSKNQIMDSKCVLPFTDHPGSLQKVILEDSTFRLMVQDKPESAVDYLIENYFKKNYMPPIRILLSLIYKIRLNWEVYKKFNENLPVEAYSMLFSRSFFKRLLTIDFNGAIRFLGNQLDIVIKSPNTRIKIICELLLIKEYELATKMILTMIKMNTSIKSMAKIIVHCGVHVQYNIPQEVLQILSSIDFNHLPHYDTYIILSLISKGKIEDAYNYFNNHNKGNHHRDTTRLVLTHVFPVVLPLNEDKNIDAWFEVLENEKKNKFITFYDSYFPELDRHGKSQKINEETLKNPEILKNVNQKTLAIVLGSFIDNPPLLIEIFKKARKYDNYHADLKKILEDANKHINDGKGDPIVNEFLQTEPFKAISKEKSNFSLDKDVLDFLNLHYVDQSIVLKEPIYIKNIDE